jgi:Na+-driven multidrug efflux pump
MQMGVATTMSMTPIITYNHAARNYDRVEEMKKLGFRIMIGYTGLISLLGLFASDMLSIVSSKDPGATAFIIQISFMTF